jgi:hypothetical protein
MSGFKIRVLTAGPHVVGDLGLTLDSAGAAPITVDLTSLPPQDVARSADLLALIASDGAFVVDARDDSDTTFLSKADSTQAVDNHNDTHFGVSGGRFGLLDDPTAIITDNYIVQYNLSTDHYESIAVEDLLQDFSDTIGGISGGMGIDGTDTTFVFDSSANYLIPNQDETRYDGAPSEDGAFFGGTSGYVVSDTITLSDGSVITVDAVAVGVVTGFTVTTSGATTIVEGVALTQTGTSGGGSGFTLTPEENNTTAGTMQWNVNDAFLRNTGDTLDSGTLTVASGATIDFPTGSTITIAGDVTEASIQTPAGGFTSDDDLINKLYVDSIAGGLDWKESVRFSTDADLATSFSFVDNGGVGDTVTWDSTTDTVDGVAFTGVVGTGMVIGDRILVKDMATASQNGIYTVTTGSTGIATILTRATDQDGSPATEVSGGNTVFVEDTGIGTETYKNTVWSVVFDGNITVNTDPVNWSQTAGPGALTAGIGLSSNANVFDLDVNDLVAATPVVGDFIAFHDLNGAAESSGSQSRKVTFTDLFNTLDVVNGITSNGFTVRTADDTYVSRTITINGAGNLDGLAITNGDGVAGNPVVGLDIQNLPIRSTAIDTTDRIAVWRADGTNANEYYTIAEVAGAVSASDSFSTWARSGNGTGASVVADSSADIVTLDGGIGIDLTFTPASDTISFAFTDSGMVDTAIVSSDTIPFFDASNGGEAEFRTVSSLITDLGLATLAFTTVGGDTGSAVADTPSDTLNLIGAAAGGITTVATDAPENVTFAITGADLATGGATLATGDFIIVNDSVDTASTVSLKYTFTDMITDLNLLTDTTGVTDAFSLITGGDGGTATAIGTDTITFNGAGISIVAADGAAGLDTVTFTLNIADLTDGNPGTIVVGDEIAINDGGTTLRFTWTDVITDLGLLTSGNTVNYTTYGGDSGSTSPGTNTDTINFVGGTNGGITTVASEPGTDQIAFNITPIDLTTGSSTLTVSDFIVVSDSADAVATVALKYTFTDVIDDLNLLTSTTGVTNAFGLIAGGDGGVTATAIGTDTITVNGTGINVTTTNGVAAADTLNLVLDVSDLPAFTGTAIGTDTIAVNNAGTTEAITISAFIADLGILTAVTASVDEDELGVIVTSGSVIGFSVESLTNPAQDMAVGDEFVVNNVSEGTGGAQRKMTGQQVADGVKTICGIDSLTFTDINGQSMLTQVDTTRGSKVLSIDSHSYQWSDNSLADNNWVNIGNAADTDSGWIMPFDGTIVGATAFTEDGKLATMAIDIYIDGVDSGPVGTLTGAGNAEFTDTTLDINFVQSQKLRLRGDLTAGTGGIEDVNIMIMVRWRDV